MKKATYRTIVMLACALAGTAALLCAAWWLTERVKATRQAAKRQELYKRLGIDADPAREFIPLPDVLPHNAPAARLGQALFVDRRLARSPYRVCGACHRLNEGGTDARALGGMLPRTAYNAIFADVFLHDGSVTGMPALVRHMIGSTNFCAGGSISNVAERLAADEKTRKGHKPQGFVKKDGIAGSWGCDYPDMGKKQQWAPEAIGMAVYMPKEYIRDTKEDDLNYLFVVKPDSKGALHYHLTFCADKEAEGYHTAKEWFASLDDWQEALEHPVRVKVK